MSTNPIELLVTLGINSEESRKNLNRYIDKLKLEDLNVTLTVDGASSNNKVFDKMQKQIEQLQNKVKELNKLLENVGNSPASGRSSRIISDIKYEQEQIRKFLKNNLGSETFDFKMNIDTSSGQKVLKGFVAQIRDINGELKKLEFDSTFNQLNASVKDDNLKTYKTSLQAVEKTLLDAKNQAKLSSNEIDKFNKKLNEISLYEVDKSGALNTLNSQIKETITSTVQFNKVAKDIDEAIMSINRSGLIGADRLDKLQESITKINSSDITLDEKVIKLRRELDLLNKEMNETAFQNKMNKAMQDAEISVKNLSSSLTKTTQVYKREALKMKNETDALKKEIEDLSRIPIFRNQKDIDDFNAKLKQTQSNVKEYGAKISEANRSSLTFLQSVKIALIRSVFIQ